MAPKVLPYKPTVKINVVSLTVSFDNYRKALTFNDEPLEYKALLQLVIFVYS